MEQLKVLKRSYIQKRNLLKKKEKKLKEFYEKEIESIEAQKKVEFSNLKKLALEEIKEAVKNENVTVFIKINDRYFDGGHWGVVTGFYVSQIFHNETFFIIESLDVSVAYGEHTPSGYYWGQKNISLNPLEHNFSTDENIWKEIEEMKERYLN